jgi:hypothetical protein
MTSYQPLSPPEQISKHDHAWKQTLKFSAPPSRVLVIALDFTGGAFVALAAGVLFRMFAGAGPALPA